MVECRLNSDSEVTRDYKTVLWRCLRLRCPACGKGRIFRGWFSNFDCCAECGYDFVREPGFYLGSIYVNYGLTAVLLVAVCSPIVLFTETSYTLLTPIALAFCVAFPTWFHRYARSIWLGFDYRWDGFRTARRHAEPDPAAEPAGDGPRIACPFCHHRSRYDSTDDGWVECRKCGQKILAA